MLITRETDYALRCILHLSFSPHEITMVDEIAKARAIPKGFLAKILQKLVRARIVKSFRGAKGGFKLAKDPKKISLLDVIEVFEGSAAMNRCAVDRRLCNLSDTCPVHPVWVEMRKEVESRLKNYTFAKLTTAKK